MSGGSRLSDLDGNVLNHHTGVSCMSQYSVVDRGSVVVIDKSVNIQDAALFGCAVMTGVGAVINTARIRPGDSVAIIGLGGVGLNGIIGAKLGGAETIIAVDIDPSKFIRAKELGATHCFDSRNNDTIEEIRELTNGGVDFAIDLAGVIPAMNTAYELIRYGGTVVTAVTTVPPYRMSSYAVFIAGMTPAKSIAKSTPPFVNSLISSIVSLFLLSKQ